MGLAERIPMNTDPTATYQYANHILMSWFTPAYPIGAFAYSHGLEYAIHNGDVTSPDALKRWVCDLLQYGSGRNDAILITMSYEAESREQLTQIADMANALATSKERQQESIQLGTAFAKTTSAVHGMDLPPMPFPVTVGHAARLCNLPLAPTLSMYLHAFASNLISVAIRFMPMGQTDGQHVLAALFPTFSMVADEALNSEGNDLGGLCIGADMASMHHETMTTRIFRT